MVLSLVVKVQYGGGNRQPLAEDKASAVSSAERVSALKQNLLERKPRMFAELTQRGKSSLTSIKQKR